MSLEPLLISRLLRGILSNGCYATHLAPTSFLPRISDEDDKLGGATKEAKERLDGRLRCHLKQEIRRENSKETLSSVRRSSPKVTKDLQMENFRSKKTTIGWGKKWLIWKSSEEDECAICLVQFKPSVKIAHLRCAHRFHSDCLLPWLESNAHCPCCRATVFLNQFNAGEIFCIWCVMLWWLMMRGVWIRN